MKSINMESVSVIKEDVLNVEYGLRWVPEYVQYLATKCDLLLDDNLIDHLSLFATHEQITNNV